MAMDDILKLLVESRQRSSASQGADPMTDLISGLLGGGQSSSGGQADAMAGMLGSLLGGGGQSPSGGQPSGLGNIMSLLEMVTGAGGQGGLGQSSASNNPIMGLIQPFVKPLAEKLKISPELAMIVVSFVLQKLLAHHPTSGRDSTQFDLDNLLGQLGSGKLDPNMLQNSGMVEELSRATGMDRHTATKSLNTAFTMVGRHALKTASPSAGRKATGGVKKSTH